MTTSFPKLLVATEFAPNASGGGPAVARQMLRDWPVDKIFWWSALPDSASPFDQRVAAHQVATIPPRLYPHRRCTRLKSWLLEKVWLPSAAGHLRKTLDSFEPEAIWVIPHLWSIPALARVLPCGKFAFHTTLQDYIDTKANIARLGAERTDRLARQADELYALATTRDATSYAMIDDLRARTGREARQMLHAGLDAVDFDYLNTKRESRSSDIRIAYAGTIIVEDDFARFVEALARVRSRFSGITLEFFGSFSYQSRDWFERSWMREHGILSATDLARRLKQCTWGFAPMSLSDDDPRYNRFSFPTKFISYLAAGLPIIALGHPESGIIKMAHRYDLGPRLSSSESGLIEEELLSAFSAPDPWIRFKSEIIRCGQIEFNADEKRKALYDCLTLCSRRTRASIG